MTNSTSASSVKIATGPSSQLNCNEVNEDFFAQQNIANSLFIISCNIQSLNSKFNKLTEMIDSFNSKFKIPDVIGLQETFLSLNSPPPPVKGYHPFIHSCRSNSKGGGVGLFINENYSFSRNENLSLFIERCFESIACDIFIQNKRLTVISIYKPPSSPSLSNSDLSNAFFTNLHNLLSKAPSNTFVLLDSNINLSVDCNDSNTYLDLINSRGFINAIQLPTRITLTSCTSIDQILFNSPNLSGTSGTLAIDLSDHLPTFINCNLWSSPTKINNSKLKRFFTENNMNLFVNYLQNVNWNGVLNATSTESALELFNDIWVSLFDQCFPLRKSFINRRTQKINDFFTNGLLVSRSRKLTLYNKFLKSRNLEDKNIYIAYRNCYNKTVKQAKKLFLNQKIDKNCNPKNAWQFLSEAIGRSNKSNSSISSILLDNNLITNPTEIANSFNDFFSSIATDIVNDIPPTSSHFLSYIPDYHHDNFSFEQVDNNKVLEIINSLESKSTLDIDGFNTILIKRASQQILIPLVHIINLSLYEGHFPESLKKSRVVPIFKQGDHKDMNNYRPISCLSSFSKIFEKVAYQQLFSYLEANNILNNLQFGFQKGKSTIHALTHIMNFIAEAFNNNKFVVAIFLDYKKAFDLVNNDILIEKLKKMGIRGSCLNWFRSYLSNRKMKTMVNNHLASSFKLINRSVPQGSILGPLLFLIYINDMPSCTNLLSVLFADDTTALTSGDDINLVGPLVNNELQKISMWLKSNELSINAAKTKVMIFSNKRPIPDFRFVLNNNDPNSFQNPSFIHEIERLKSSSKTPFFKMLGVYFDESLSFNYHCKKVNSKISSALFMISRAKHLLSENSLKRLYYAIIHPHLLYCLPIYSFTSKKNISTLFKKQKQAIRVINKAKYNSHTEPLFHKCDILPLNDLIIQQKLVFMHPLAHNYSLVSFRNFSKLSNVQNHEYPLLNN